MALGVDSTQLADPQGAPCLWATPEGFEEGHLQLTGVEKVIFNFPHTKKRGRKARLVRDTFAAVRSCIGSGFCNQSVEIEMRLQDHSAFGPNKIRTDYEHEAASAAADFVPVLAGAPSDLGEYEGYAHRFYFEERLWRRRCFRSVHSLAMEASLMSP